jgi:hypothetical protein
MFNYILTYIILIILNIILPLKIYLYLFIRFPVPAIFTYVYNVSMFYNLYCQDE